jgi:hypothetical protein
MNVLPPYLFVPFRISVPAPSFTIETPGRSSWAGEDPF